MFYDMGYNIHRSSKEVDIGVIRFDVAIKNVLEKHLFRIVDLCRLFMVGRTGSIAKRKNPFF